MSANQRTVHPDPTVTSDDRRRARRMLSQENWSFRRVGEPAWLSATVPGCNYSDLQNCGAIDDPFYGDNEAKLQWIEREDWEYRCHFDLDAAELEHDIELVFDGLDTYATVSLNGAVVLNADNMFRTYRVLCREQLTSGDNELVIVFRSPILENLPRHASSGFTYPAENDKSEERLSVYARKAPYHFGWDWGPRFVTSGVWRDVYLDLYKSARILNTHVRIDEISDAQATLGFDIEIDATEAVDCQLLVECQERRDICVTIPIQAAIGSSHHQVELRVSEPKLWWPNGLGDAHLYNFTVSLVQDENCLDKTDQRIGIRTVDVVNDDDEHGESFYIKVNGEPVFMKGANYIPSDSFLDRVPEEKYQRVFSDAVDANMNMLRVWGGGVYESNLFYDLADEHGILIWQDFMFACSLYPADDEFLKSVRAEAVDNVVRLRNHPCIALWCGNNEVAMGIECWDWPEKFGYSEELCARLKDDYGKLFHEMLPSVVEEEDGERFYLPSSPIGFWENPEEDGKGNSHYWGVWHGGQAFDEYRRRVSRFVTEYGFQSFPILDSVRQFSSEQDWDIDSRVMQTHQRHSIGNHLIRDYLKRSYPDPDNFEHFLYLSQIQQADGLRVAFEAHRSAMPYCMGTLYWQMNDCWPVASWSGIDYYGRWKALHYQARRSFAPIAVFAASQGDELEVRVVSDLLLARAVRLSVELVDFSGDVLWSRSQAISVPPNESTVACSISKHEMLSGHDPSRVMAAIRLFDREQTVSQSNYYFVPMNELALEKPNIFWSRDTSSDAPSIRLTSNTLARGVYVRIGNLPPHSNLSDNFFDLLPGEDKLVFLRSGALPENADIDVMSMFDTL